VVFTEAMRIPRPLADPALVKLPGALQDTRPKTAAQRRIGVFKFMVGRLEKVTLYLIQNK
jgi:hypothetical protein